MEKILNLQLSLEEISLRRVTVLLWSQSDILHSLDDLGVESEVEYNIKKLQLSTKLSERMRVIVKPIGEELKKWKKFHEGYTFNPNINMTSISKHLRWTTLGTLDYRKTAETLIRHETFVDDILYRLACLYCLDEYIPVLWEKLDESCKTFFYKEKGPVKLFKPELEFCWPYILKGEETRLSFTKFGDNGSFNQILFKYSAHKGNKAATEYFFRKLPDDIREGLLLNRGIKVHLSRYERDEALYCNRKLPRDNFPEEKVDEVLVYLLCLMNPEQQLGYFRILPTLKVQYFLDWPWTFHFLDIMNLCFWPICQDFEYSMLLMEITSKMNLGYQLSNVFQEAFLSGPSDFKNYFVDDFAFTYAIEDLFNVDDSKSLKLIFRNTDLASRKRYISSWDGFVLFYNTISAGNWHLVELCFQEITLSKEDKEGIKNAYAGFVTERDALNIEIWQILLIIIDDGEVRFPCKRKSDMDDQLKNRKKNRIEV